MTTVSKAKRGTTRKYPLAAYITWSLKVTESRNLPYAFGIDQYWRLYFNPEIVGSLTEEQATSKLLEEVSHVLFRHGERAKKALGDNPKLHFVKLWNRAADIAVRYGLSLQGIYVDAESETCWSLGYPEGLPVEGYFRLLCRDNPEPKPQPAPQPTSGPSWGESAGSGGQGGGEEDESDDESDEDDEDSSDESNEDRDEPERARHGDPDDDDQEDDEPEDGEEEFDDWGTDEANDDSDQEDQDDEQDESDQGEQDSTPEPEPEPDEPEESAETQQGGSAADGIERDWELGYDPELEAEFGGDQGRDATLQFAAQKALERSRGQGTGGCDRWVEELLRPAADPCVKLRNMLTRRIEQYISGIGEYSYRRPSRRSHADVLIAGHVAPVPRIAVLVDTSASMIQQDLALALGVINQVINGLNLRDGVEYYCGDTKIHTSGKVLDAKKVKLVGGGGTSMDELICAIGEPKDRRKQPDIVICCTDAETAWPDHKVRVPVLAAVTSAATKYDRRISDIPPWIEYVCLAHETRY